MFSSLSGLDKKSKPHTMEVLHSMPEQFPLPQSYPNSMAQLLKLWDMTYMGVI